jgi:hypothetical protein
MGNIPADHALRSLFLLLVEKAFSEDLRWRDRYVSRYIADLMADFAHADRLYPLRDSTGKPVDQVAEMLAEGDVRLRAASFEREREVHKYIGDYTLFMTGIFPEHLKRLKITKMLLSPDYLVDYVKVGKRSYRIVSEFDYGKFKESTPLYRKLSENFEVCVIGLGSVRREIDRMKLRKIRRLAPSFGGFLN